ncbi:MAG: ATP-binding protein [Verrucomicrobiota bacterium]
MSAKDYEACANNRHLGLDEDASSTVNYEMLMASVAHDYNNTLAVIQANLQLLNSSERLQDFLDDEEKEMLSTALLACQSGAELTRRLIAYTGVGKEEKVELNVRDVVVECVRMCRKGFEGGGVAPEILVGPSVLSSKILIEMGYSAMTHTVMNLIKNAVEATLETNRLDPVRIHLDHVEVEGRKWVHLYVADRGAGIRDEDMEQIFVPRFTTKNKKQLGSGLGLAGARNLVRDAGGEIRAISKWGQGTTMTITLPIQQIGEVTAPIGQIKRPGKAIPANQNERAMRAVTQHDIVEEANRLQRHAGIRNSRNIYVVDDERIVGVAISRMIQRLKRAQNEVIYLPSGEELIMRISEDKTLPEWIFIDYSMPGMNGVETLRRIFSMAGHDEQEIKKMGVVILSGMQVEEKAELIEEYPHINFFSKPFSMESMQRLFEKADGGSIKASLKSTSNLKLPPIAKPTLKALSALKN